MDVQGSLGIDEFLLSRLTICWRPFLSLLEKNVLLVQRSAEPGYVLQVDLALLQD
jgi:hypothetical protein